MKRWADWPFRGGRKKPEISGQHQTKIESYLVGLRENIPIPEYIFERMLNLRADIIASIKNRDDIISSRDLDRVFCIGDLNWTEGGGGNDYIEASRLVQGGGYDILNVLRFWSQCFTGYKIMRLEAGRGTRSVEPIPDNYDVWLATNRATPDEWCAHWKSLMALNPKHVFSPPPIMGEIGWRIDGVIVSHDTCAYQERLSFLEHAGIFEFLQSLGRPPRILEIGGGYGALASAIHAHYPATKYAICDLPESLVFSGLYLLGATGLTPALYKHEDEFALVEPFTLIPNYLFSFCDSSDTKFDLVINTLSMSEMSEHQVRRYAEGIKKLIGDDGVFFEQNQDNRHLGMIYAKELLGDFFPFNKQMTLAVPGVHGAADLWSNKRFSVSR